MVDRHHPGKAPTALLQALADGSCQTIDQLEVRLDLTRRQVSNAAACLMRRDYLMRMGAGCYQLTEAGQIAVASGEVIKSGPRGPHSKPKVHRDTLRQRAWKTMRRDGWFTVHELITFAARSGDRDPASNLHRYIRALCNAGYVRVAARRIKGTALTSNGFKQFALVKNTGPLSPIVHRNNKSIHDQNLGEDVPCAPR